MVIGFADLLESLSAAPVILQHKPSAVEVMDKSILDHTRQNAGLDRIRNTFIAGDPARDAVRRILRGPEGRSAAAPAGARSRSAGAQARLPLSLRNGSGRAGAHLEPARSRAGAFDGDEGRREIDFVCRRHGGGAGKTQRVHRTLSGDRARPRNHGRHLRARVGGLSARASGHQHEDRGRRAQVRSHRATTWPIWCWNSAARFRASMATGWCAARSCGRCSATRCTKRFAKSSALSIRTAFSIPARLWTRRR